MSLFLLLPARGSITSTRDSPMLPGFHCCSVCVCWAGLGCEEIEAPSGWEQEEKAPRSCLGSFSSAGRGAKSWMKTKVGTVLCLMSPTEG